MSNGKNLSVGDCVTIDDVIFGSNLKGRIRRIVANDPVNPYWVVFENGGGVSEVNFPESALTPQSPCPNPWPVSTDFKHQ